MIEIPKFTFGVGDRFAHQGVAQLRAFVKMRAEGVDVYPVWNKSFREHSIIGTKPITVREEADAAVKALGWDLPYFVDADHITLETMNDFVEGSDFFTLDVADFVGKPSPDAKAFAQRIGGLDVAMPGGLPNLVASQAEIEKVADKFLAAVQQAGKIYRAVEAIKGKGNFITEVSMDETDDPQSAVELFLIVAMIAEEKIPAQTVAPKFPGRFNKGVDYVGDVAQFAREFEKDVAAVQVAGKKYGLPATFKLSVHSGSDKFSIYPLMFKACEKYGAGLHVKTAGTTWVEEAAGLAAAGDDGLAFVKELYASSFEHIDELAAPYAAVIDIDRSKLPAPAEASSWSGERFAAALRHEPDNPDYNMHMRQLIHIGYKFAAKESARYYALLDKYAGPVGDAVTDNVYRRHMLRLFK